MLPENRRLRKTTQFEAVFRDGKGVREDGLLGKVLANSAGVSRFGIIVSKKVAKEATARNRARRLIREAVRKRLPNVAEGKDLVILALPSFQGASAQETDALVQEILRKSGLLNHHD